jgi:hypothetical protein
VIVTRPPPACWAVALAPAIRTAAPAPHAMAQSASAFGRLFVGVAT